MQFGVVVQFQFWGAVQLHVLFFTQHGARGHVRCWRGCCVGVLLGLLF